MTRDYPLSRYDRGLRRSDCLLTPGYIRRSDYVRLLISTVNIQCSTLHVGRWPWPDCGQSQSISARRADTISPFQIRSTTPPVLYQSSPNDALTQKEEICSTRKLCRYTINTTCHRGRDNTRGEGSSFHDHSPPKRLPRWLCRLRFKFFCQRDIHEHCVRGGLFRSLSRGIAHTHSRFPIPHSECHIHRSCAFWI